ncbi:fibronectin type III domain-containing protein [Demequina litorisediminis]|uniref:Fibronectin type-III domain-containing protein n=1 Tax=Demequina litorisediminis TaxID=1849022 RepID=A0ABQ6IIH5_9MICO|nr:fibronectin type III domain-containing protein [Demequina litorisediminis]GMA37689.1 hypothetical protein GCM10025876_38930 [Demequina litorisediminis]
MAGKAITASWTALTGSAAGTDQPVSYLVQYREKATDDDWSTASVGETAPNGTSFTTNALVKGVTYQFRVAGQNSEGVGPWSDVKELETATAPTSAPTLTATPKVGELSLRIGSVSATGGSPITGYQVKYRQVGASAWSTKNIERVTTYVLTGLKQAVNYDVSVAAVNAVGAGPATTVRAGTQGLPSAPTSVKVARGDRQATVAWGAPTKPNGTVTSYLVQKRLGTTGTWATAGTTTGSTKKFVAKGLTNGSTYQFRVVAKTSVGTGAYSAAVKVVPAGKPIAPSSVKAVSDSKGLLTVTWPKASGNGLPVTGYTVKYSTNGSTYYTLKKVGASTLKVTTTKGSHGKRVYFKVYTHNALGTSTERTTSVIRK